MGLSILQILKALQKLKGKWMVTSYEEIQSKLGFQKVSILAGNYLQIIIKANQTESYGLEILIKRLK